MMEKGLVWKTKVEGCEKTHNEKRIWKGRKRFKEGGLNKELT